MAYHNPLWYLSEIRWHWCAGDFHFGVEIPAWMAYNMLNKVADTIVHTYPFPAKILVKIAPLLCQSGGAIFYVQHSPKWQQ